MYKNKGYDTTKKNRLIHEFNLFSNMDSSNCQIITQNEIDEDEYIKINEIHAYIIGKKNTPYYGYKFEVVVNLGELYPYKPLSVRFDTNIKHININDGIIISRCINLDPKSATLIDLLEEMVELIEKPQIEHTVDFELLELYKNNKSEYEVFIKKHCEIHAIKIDYSTI